LKTIRREYLPGNLVRHSLMSWHHGNGCLSPSFWKNPQKNQGSWAKGTVKTQIVKIVNNPSILKTPALQPKANERSIYPPVQIFLSV
jgi:hypothetical protein